MVSKWKSPELSRAHLEGVRDAIPSATIQIDVMLKIVSLWAPDVIHVLDVGYGDGVLGRAILNRFPIIRLSLLDFSDPMLEAARKKAPKNTTIRYIKADFSSAD